MDTPALCSGNHTDACQTHNVEKHPNTIWCQDVRPCDPLDHEPDTVTP